MTKFRHTLIVVLPLACTFLAGPAQALAADGYWEFLRAELTKPKLEYKGLVLEPSTVSGDFVIRARVRDGNTGQWKFNWTAAFRWTPMPRTLVPGTRVSVKIRQTITEKPKTTEHHRSLAGVQLHALAGKQWVNRGALVGPKGKSQVMTVSNWAQQPPQELTLSGGVPAGSKDAQIALAVVIWHATEVPWTWRYVYVWRQGTPPARPGDPIPPATETDATKAKLPPKDTAPARPGEGTGQPGDTRTGQPGGTRTGQPGGTRTGQPGGTRVGPIPATPPGAPTGPGIPATGMTLVADRRQVKAGGEVWLPIWLLRARDVGNMNFTVTYDPSVVRPVGEAAGNLLSGAIFRANLRQSGLTRIGLAAQQGLSGDGTVAQIRFQAVGKPGDRSPIRLEVTTANSAGGSPLQVATVDGEIELLTAAGRVPGDANGNGKLDLADALAALEMSVKLIPQDLVCDVDVDGTVTSNDARILFQRVYQR